MINIHQIHDLCINESFELIKPKYWIGQWDDVIYYRKVFVYLINKHPTNIVEIGSHNGSSTYFFGKLLENHSKTNVRRKIEINYSQPF